ncbi:unnamed protein product, partial [Meganyctiphanes norvegica]
ENLSEIKNQDSLSTEKEIENDSKFNCGTTFWNIIRISIKNLLVMRSMRAIIIIIGSIAIINGYPQFLMTIPFALQASGHSLETAAWVVSVSAVSSFIARMAVSIMSDMPWFNMRIVYMSGALLTAVTTIIFALLSDLTWQMVTISFWGFGVGTNMSLYNLVVLEFMGKEHVPAMVGTTCLLNAVFANIIGPIAGFIRDVSGSYAVNMCFLGAVVGTSFIAWLFMPLAQAFDKSREEKNMNNS